MRDEELARLVHQHRVEASGELTAGRQPELVAHRAENGHGQLGILRDDLHESAEAKVPSPVIGDNHHPAVIVAQFHMKVSPSLVTRSSGQCATYASSSRQIWALSTRPGITQIPTLFEPAKTPGAVGYSPGM